MSLAVPSQRTWSVSDIVTAAEMNANVRDAVNFLTGKPVAQLNQSAVQSIANNAWTATSFDVSQLDSYSGHSDTVNNSRYTGQVAGWYDVWGSITWAANGTGRRIISIFVNGTELGEFRQELPPSASNNLTNVTAALVYLNVGDYVEVRGFQSSGAALNTAPSPVTMKVDWVHR